MLGMLLELEGEPGSFGNGGNGTEVRASVLKIRFFLICVSTAHNGEGEYAKWCNGVSSQRFVA